MSINNKKIQDIQPYVRVMVKFANLIHQICSRQYHRIVCSANSFISFDLVLRSRREMFRLKLNGNNASFQVGHFESITKSKFNKQMFIN